MKYAYGYDKEMLAGNAATDASYPGSHSVELILMVLFNLNTDYAYTFDNLCNRNMSLCCIVSLFLYFYLDKK